MKPTFKPIIAALVFSAALIASAYFLKGNPVKGWIDTPIYALGFIFLFRYLVPMPKKCASKVEQK